MIVEGLARSEPSNIDAKSNLLTRYLDVGQAQDRKGSRLEAQQTYCQARTIIQTLINLEPQNEKWRKSLTEVEQQLRATPDGGPVSCGPSADRG